MHLKTCATLLLLFASTLASRAEIQTINLLEKQAYPTLQSVSAVFRSTHQPEVMFVGVASRFKEASLDQIAESGLDFFEARSANLSGLINQVLALGNLTTRVLNGEKVRLENQERIRQELATVSELKRTLYLYLSNVPAQNRILVNYRGSARDIRMQIDRLEQDCAAAAVLSHT